MAYFAVQPVVYLVAWILLHVDYRNQQRIMKDSAFWYKHVIETNGVEL